MYIKRKSVSGFTLAEILVTLSVIGLVAVLAIPCIVNQVRELRADIALKKAMAELTNTYKIVTLENGVDYDCYFSRGSCEAGTCEHLITDCDKLWSAIAGKMNVVKACSGDTLGNCLPSKGIVYKNPADQTMSDNNCSGYSVANQNLTKAWLLADGKSIFLYYGGYYDMFAVDLNGPNKGPNEWEEDVFSFNIYEDGKYSNNINSATGRSTFKIAPNWGCGAPTGKGIKIIMGDEAPPPPPPV